VCQQAAKANKNKLEILGAFSNMFASSAARFGGQLRRHLFRHGCRMSTAVSGIVNVLLKRSCEEGSKVIRAQGNATLCESSFFNGLRINFGTRVACTVQVLALSPTLRRN
jgi:hypothetical protein